MSSAGRAEAYAAFPGETVVIPAGMPHGVTFLEGGVLLPTHVQYVAFSGLDILALHRVPRVIGGAGSSAIAETQEALANAYAPDAGEGMSVLALRKELGMRLLRLLLSHAAPAHPGESLLGIVTWLPAVIRHIHRSLDRALRREDLSALSGLSASQFTVRFSEAIGMPPMRYVRRVRLERAMEYLTLSDLSVTDIAERLAYCDPYHFSKQFKAETGHSPRQYRTQMREALRDHATGRS